MMQSDMYVGGGLLDVRWGYATNLLAVTHWVVCLCSLMSWTRFS